MKYTQSSTPRAYNLDIRQETTGWAQSGRKRKHEMTSVSLRTLLQCTRSCQVIKGKCRKGEF